ncbi:MAG: hypothetical protein PQJ50_11115, partial [Spirochaetales bacterium]|nr:hypothetical protein [Spirochaetales bacterium]
FGLFKEGCLTLEDVKSRIKQDSRRYAKRQMTFFSSLEGVNWFHPDNVAGIRELIDNFNSARS